MNKLHLMAIVVTVAVTPTAAGASPPPEKKDQPCSTTVNPPDRADGRSRIWLAGDSTMAEPGPGPGCPVGWGSQLAPLLDDGVTVDNQAVAGRSIQSWLYEDNVTATMTTTGECLLARPRVSQRWEAMLDRRTGLRPGDHLIIQFGINDDDPACPRHVGPERYQRLLTLMARAALRRGAHPVLLTAVAAITCQGSRAVKNRGFVEQTYAAGDATGAPVIDLQTLSVGLYNRHRLCPNDADEPGRFFSQDRNHFDTEGARQVAALVAGAARDQHLPLETYLS